MPYIFETYFNYKTQEIFKEYPPPVNIDLRNYILYKTPTIIKKTPTIHELIMNVDYPIDEELCSNLNIKIVYIHSNNNWTFASEVVQSKIAHLQNIYSLDHKDSSMIHGIHMCNYVHDGDFLMTILQKNIPEGIVNVNILHSFRARFGFTEDFPLNFPNSVKQIRINVMCVKESITFCTGICGNLPPELKKLIITYCDYSKINYYIEECDFDFEIKKSIKLPFGCELTINKFIF